MRVGGEDRAAFRELYRLTSAKLFGITLRICGDYAAAEEVLSEVYLIVWRRAGAWEPGRASPITWLATIARNGTVRANAPAGKPDMVEARHAPPAQVPLPFSLLQLVA